MNKVEARLKYNSIDFRIKEQENKSKKEKKHAMQGLKMSLDLTNIKNKTKTAGEFYRVTELYFKNRPEFCTDGDYIITSHTYTILTLCGEVVIKACDMLNLNPIDDAIVEVDCREDENTGEVIAGVSLKINKDIPKNKSLALRTIFDEFQQNIGSEKKSSNPSDTSVVDDGNFEDIDIDEYTAQA